MMMLVVRLYKGNKYMAKAILVMDMPDCCDKCFALDDNGDYPMCGITQEQRGYTFNTRARKMDKCPIKELPEKMKYHDGTYNGEVKGWNLCLEEILKEEQNEYTNRTDE